MSYSTIFGSIPFVTGPLSLAAFAAAVFLALRLRLIKRAENLILGAAVEERGAIVSGLLEVLNLKPEELTKQQRFALLQQTLADRRQRTWMVFAFSLVVGCLLAWLSYLGIQDVRASSDTEQVVGQVLKGPQRAAAIQRLKRDGIFEAGAGDLVDFMIEHTSTELGEKPLTNLERIQLTENNYKKLDSVHRLRVLAENGHEPFRPVGAIVTVTMPTGMPVQPRQFVVNVPMDSPLAHKVVNVSGQSKNDLTLLARPTIDRAIRDTGAHVNPEQARFLHGGTLPDGGARMVLTEILETRETRLFDPNCVPPQPPFQVLARKLCEKSGVIAPDELRSLVN